MGVETKQLATIAYVTDTDVSYYEMGEVEGSFQEAMLKGYIKRYGHERLCAQLGYMQFQVWKTLREISGEKDSEYWADCAKENPYTGSHGTTD